MVQQLIGTNIWVRANTHTENGPHNDANCVEFKYTEYDLFSIKEMSFAL